MLFQPLWFWVPCYATIDNWNHGRCYYKLRSDNTNILKPCWELLFWPKQQREALTISEGLICIFKRLLWLHCDKWIRNVMVIYGDHLWGYFSCLGKRVCEYRQWRWAEQKYMGLANISVMKLNGFSDNATLVMLIMQW